MDHPAPNSAKGPLTGVTVLDLTRALAGPFSTLLLAGLGANVIRIEIPERGDGRDSAPFLGKDGTSLRRQHGDDVSIAHLIRHRGKKSITLNLKHGEARRIFSELVRHVDVVVENFTRGTAERLGVGYSQAKEANPRIIYCSISGFGQEGSAGGGKALDGTIQALSGIMFTSGTPADPPIRHGVPFADLNTPLFAVIGITSALYHRAVSGEGQHIDVSMLGAMTALQSAEPYKVLEDLGVPMRTGSTVPRLAPFGVFPASDGSVVICSNGNENFTRLSRVMERPDLLTDQRYATQGARLENYLSLDHIIADWTRRYAALQLVERLEAAGIAAATVRTPDEATHDERVLARGEVVPLQHPLYGDGAGLLGPGVPILFSRTKASIDSKTAALGEHNQLIYGDLLGLSPEALAKLRAEGVI